MANCGYKADQNFKNVNTQQQCKDQPGRNFPSPSPHLDQWSLRTLLGIKWHRFVCRCKDDSTCNGSPPENWKRPPGHPRIMWLNTVKQDLTAYNLTLNEAVDLA